MARNLDAVPLEQVRRALVINLRHLGDVLLSSPVPQVLKNHAPHCEIDALVYSDAGSMLTLHPALAQVHVIDRGWKALGILDRARAEWKLFQEMKSRNYDLVVALTPHRRSQWLAKAFRPRWAVATAYPAAGKGWKNTFPYIVQRPIATWRHTVEIYLDSLRRIGCHPGFSERDLILIAGSDAEIKVAGLLVSHGLIDGNFIHIHPGSRWKFKCWPAASFAALIDKLHADGWKVVLTAAPDAGEQEMIANILAFCNAPVTNLAGQLTLKELAALSAKARLFIGVDSAPMHIAAAVNTPQVALFGPSGSREWGPWSTQAKVLTNSDYQCVPCGRAGCTDSKRSECLEQLSVDKVANAVTLQLDRIGEGGSVPPEWIAHLASPESR